MLVYKLKNGRDSNLAMSRFPNRLEVSVCKKDKRKISRCITVYQLTKDMLLYNPLHYAFKIKLLFVKKPRFLMLNKCYTSLYTPNILLIIKGERHSFNTVFERKERKRFMELRIPKIDKMQQRHKRHGNQE